MRMLLVLVVWIGCLSCSHLEPAHEVVELQPCREIEVDETSYTTIFLAGTIDMGNSIDWQAATIEQFRSAATGRYLFFNPRRDGGLDGSQADLHAQIRWELEHLERADVIVMNILGSSQSPISLLEMGLHMRSGKLLVACEPDYYRYDNVRITCERYAVPFYDSFDALLRANFKEICSPE